MPTRKQPARASKPQKTILQAFHIDSSGDEASGDDEPPVLESETEAESEDEDRVFTTPPTKKAKGPGRPRKEVKSIFDDKKPAHDYSLTVVKRGGHVTQAWFNSVKEFCIANGVRFFMAFERGGNAENLHIQCVVTFYVEPEHVAKLIKLIKEAIGIKNGDGQKG